MYGLSKYGLSSCSRTLHSRTLHSRTLHSSLHSCTRHCYHSQASAQAGNRGLFTSAPRAAWRQYRSSHSSSRSHEQPETCETGSAGDPNGSHNSGQPAAETSPFDLGPYTGAARIAPGDKVYVAMSGGVDSSTVAAMAAARFAHVEGVYMNNWSADARCQEASWRDVRRVCALLGIPCRRIDLEHDYWTDVFEPMLAAYRRGDTPNPDLGCNLHIKFGRLLASLRRADPAFRWLATGHYAGLDPASGLVRRAQYTPKDQSYYLATVSRAALRHAVFPLAHLSKPRVRELAAELGLPAQVATKPDSQGLCFVEQQQDVGARGFRRFLAEYLADEPGPFVLASDPHRVVGEHRGLWTHTIGQRASVPMPQTSPHMRGQWFVVAKDVARNALLIAPGTNNERLFTSQIESLDFRWHTAFPSDCSELYAQYRSLQQPWKVARVDAVPGTPTPGTPTSDTPTPDTPTPDTPTLFTFDSERRAIAPGQYIVVYDRDVVVGAGTIARAFRGP